MKVRQDAWSEENDLLLAETVLRHVREGSTQLNAFEEVGDKLNRTSAACGFRWNAVVRHQYEKALQLAKKQRKQRQRMLGKDQGGKKKLLYSPPVPTVDDFEALTVSTSLEMGSMDLDSMETFITAETLDTNVNSPQEEELANYQSEEDEQPLPAYEAKQAPVYSSVNHSQAGTLNFDMVLSYLQNFRNATIQMEILKSENERLKREMTSIKSRNKELEDKLHQIENNSETMQEDYETLMKIMNRARKLVLLEEDERPTKFKMDRNGNLEKVAE
ncbi:RsfA family transcriptional regulator [Bacillus circulans]|jgi:prespore-specific regulator|uniref:RsfA family transcriptional regulator n=1 Tax=Niallia TaxID=2837506 RepID=UPI0014904A54|nr:RsfA family transcriptional regulator [Niallia circulans]NRG26990.1 RsfA family transcriptional regulator [Niallia circulans]QJX64351.1 RsfA family transcriptional regulator [Niallia circulans]